MEKNNYTRIVDCEECGKRWLAVCYKISDRLQCPNCNYMTQVPPQECDIDVISSIINQLNYLIENNDDAVTLYIELIETWKLQLLEVKNAINEKRK